MYRMDVKWEANEIAAFRRYNSMCREQALAIFAWDRASVEGLATGPRPACVPAADLAATARLGL